MRNSRWHSYNTLSVFEEAYALLQIIFNLNTRETELYLLLHREAEIWMEKKRLESAQADCTPLRNGNWARVRLCHTCMHMHTSGECFKKQIICQPFIFKGNVVKRVLILNYFEDPFVLYWQFKLLHECMWFNTFESFTGSPVIITLVKGREILK